MEVPLPDRRVRKRQAQDALPDGEGVEDAGAADFDDSAWDTIAVPAHWVLEGDGRYGHPIYTNIKTRWRSTHRTSPMRTPTGDYRRTVEPPEFEAAAAVLLRNDGVESRYRVWVNGIDIVVGSGSRLAQEFDVTDAVHPGKNHLAVRVHRWSASSYLEDQDQWWLPGSFAT